MENGVENLSDDFLQYSVRIHQEAGDLTSLGINDLKTIFCVVVNNGGIEGGGGGSGGGAGSIRRPGSGSEGWGREAHFAGWRCRYVDDERVPNNNVVCGNKVVISKRFVIIQ